MMSLEEIRSAASKYARIAKRRKVKPLIINSKEDINAESLRGIPFLGDYVPEGFYLMDELFVDSSGFGRPGEPALTFEKFLEKVEVGKAYALREAGEFQVYVGVYGVNAK